MSHAYVHGYGHREQERLHDQARTLSELLHHDTRYPTGSRVLEAGCGTGAQTLTIAAQSPGAHVTCIDISAESLAHARERTAAAGLRNLSFQQADLRALPFDAASFDHVFVCFVLEHLPDPVDVLRTLLRLVRPGGTLTVIEGDHGSVMFHPESAAARHTIDCQVQLQARAGGDACIGRRLQPLLRAAGAAQAVVSPRFVYADASRPAWVDGFTRKTFTAMIEGVKDEALAAGLSTPAAFDDGLRALQRTAEPDGVFCYTFFKAVVQVA
ncbi:class I SAM-dependent methyltransferase [Piscinibacter sp. HJYY11]|uniref:class I SAM-dependent methyltransferase n=1 Tax=Piscinibacter sp. HJYY11 TaxID=2801333 RepID=UPI00191D51A4|nr:class I SAM-dependent methyltransferase [Piscinibacter sp. HJYY11]MBL0730981.1 methyltransferase domain-containing protein [Piscinibacter sp. HJYY11]